MKIGRIDKGIGVFELDDGSTIPMGEMHVVISTDSYTVHPLFFPGGDIGKLAAVGSINDVVVMGAKPVAMLDAIVVEEGFPMKSLETIMNSMLRVLTEEGVALLGGDVKVMPRGGVDGVVITTTCIGVTDKVITDSGLVPGDSIVISGTIAEHGATIMALQAGLEVEGELKSDCEPLTKVIEIAKSIGEIHAAKDITRGGLASSLNELAEKSNVTILVDEDKIPISENVRVYCEMLGIDPLVLASEGRALIGIPSSRAEELVRELRKAGYRQATIIGRVVDRSRYNVLLETVAGGRRILEKPLGEIVPRIC